MLLLPRFSMGIGDRFAMQGEAQLKAFADLAARGVIVAPTWNKSNREHTFIGSVPGQVRTEADNAVQALGWNHPYFVDADHIGLRTVDKFLAAADFYTLDVADFIGHTADPAKIEAFAAQMTPASGELKIPGIDQALKVTRDQVKAIAAKYLYACEEAGQIYRHIEAAKGKGNFVTEVSMDETDLPQTPLDLWFILGALAHQGVPAQTIAPKFSGRFNKGVDFVGDLAVFDREFNEDLLVIAQAVKEFGLPADLKLSVHSGSDKFSLYGPMGKAIRKHNAGLHLKTAGTNWLEEVTGLAEAGGEGLAIAKEVYLGALARFDEVTPPYATVIDIDKAKLPGPQEMKTWTAEQFVHAVNHDQTCPGFNPSVRQLIHVGFKVAAEMGDRYTNAVKAHRAVIANRVTSNLYDKHLVPLFLGQP